MLTQPTTFWVISEARTVIRGHTLPRQTKQSSNRVLQSRKENFWCTTGRCEGREETADAPRAGGDTTTLNFPLTASLPSASPHLALPSSPQVSQLPSFTSRSLPVSSRPFQPRLSYQPPPWPACCFFFPLRPRRNA